MAPGGVRFRVPEGGGFIMLSADPEHRYRLIESLNAAGGQASAVRLSFSGPETWGVKDE